MDPSFHKLNTLPDIKPSSTKRSSPLPDKIGPYKIESLLNQGGMSLLYLGIHPTTLEPIAVKVLIPKYLKNKEINARFLKEAKIIRAAEHPNVVKLYDMGQWEKGLYMAMEFIRGVSLRQFIQKQSFSLKKALEIILEVAHALAHLHAHGVIHRDLKPENIIITENGSIKLIDFGISQLQDEATQIITQKRMGTPFYMSPEQLENPNQISTLTDIYAVGIIAYELILGRSTHGVVHLSLLPSNLKKIIEKALQINPDLRYQTINDFIGDITCYLKEFEETKGAQEEASSTEVLNYIEHTRSILLSKTVIRLPQLEIGLATQEGSATATPYLDFFPLSDNRLAIVLAESVHLNPMSFTYTAILRGMVRMAIETTLQKEKNEGKIPDLLSVINEALYKDASHEKFHFSFLLLNCDRNLLSFVSCSYTDLWHIEEGSQKVRELSTPNPLLASSTGISFLQTNDNWNSGDMLVLHSIQNDNKTPDFNLFGHRLLSPQHLANELIESLHPKETAKERTSALLTIHRIF